MSGRGLIAAVLLVPLLLALCTGCKEEGDIFLIAADTKLPATTAVPPGGTYASDQSVVLLADEPAVIYYTTNGSDPTEASSQYSAPIVIPAVEGTTVLKFFAKDTAGNSESIKTQTYVIDLTAPTTTASPPGGTYTWPQNVALYADEAATIYWTADGTDPTVSSAVYSAPVSAPPGSTRLKFFARDAVGNSETIKTEVYLVQMWTAPVNASGTPNDSWEPSVAVDSTGIAHIAWRDWSSPGYDIDYATSFHWAGTQATVSNSSVASMNPVMAIDSNDVAHVVWAEYVGSTNYEIYYANSTDWAGTQTNISNTADWSEVPSIAIDSGDVIHVCWSEDVGGSNYEVYYANSTDWAGTRANASNTADLSAIPSVVVGAGGVIHTAWTEYVGGTNYEIFYANSTDWAGTRVNISNTAEDSVYVSAGIDSAGVVHLTWREGTANFTVYYSNSTGWAATQTNISDPAEWSESPSLVVDCADVVHIAWRELFTIAFSFEIFYANSTGWAGTRVNVSNSSDDSADPSIAVDKNGVVHIVWIREWAGDDDVYYINSGG